MLSVGIDVAEERKGLDLVALDQHKSLVASKGRLSVDQAVNLALDMKPDVVCVDSPSGWALQGKSRRSEVALRKLGITAFSTPTDPGDHSFYRWMRVGFSIYQALSPRFAVCDGSLLSGTAVEVFPEASAVLLAGRLRDKAESKRTFRGKILKDHGIEADSLPSVDRIDAALAALTGILALDGEATFLGDPAEGVILLPVSKPPIAKLVRSNRAPGALESLRVPRWNESNQVVIDVPPRVCECGCGASVRRRFLPGHDAKLRSKLIRAEASGISASHRLDELGWRT